jgi:hypothetical protein
VARLAGRIDWDRQSTATQVQADALREGRDVAVLILGPLTPRALAPLLGSGS